MTTGGDAGARARAEQVVLELSASSFGVVADFLAHRTARAQLVDAVAAALQDARPPAKILDRAHWHYPGCAVCEGYGTDSRRDESECGRSSSEQHAGHAPVASPHIQSDAAPLTPEERERLRVVASDVQVGIDTWKNALWLLALVTRLTERTP